MYSQHQEEAAILNYFGTYKPGRWERFKRLFTKNEVPTLLDIGCNDGKTHSNSAALILQGWQALVVEPCVICVVEARRFYHNIGRKVTVAPCAIGTKNETRTFYEFTKPHLTSPYGFFSVFNFDTIPENKVRQLFLKQQVDVMDYKTLCNTYNQHRFDFITINTNGTEGGILQQIDLSKTKLVCVHYDGRDESMLLKIMFHCGAFGLGTIIYKSPDNILLGR